MYPLALLPLELVLAGLVVAQSTVRPLAPRCESPL